MNRRAQLCFFLIDPQVNRLFRSPEKIMASYPVHYNSVGNTPPELEHVIAPVSGDFVITILR
jgi:hypothetical protein